MYHRFLLLLLLLTSVVWSADEQAKAEQWYKANLALIDVTLSDADGQTYAYLNSKGDVTIRVNGQEKRGTIKLAKDKTAAAFVLYIWSLPSEKMAQTNISAHIQRRIGDEREHLIRYFATPDEAKVLRGHLDALAKSLR